MTFIFFSFHTFRMNRVALILVRQTKI
jgi:hypothetical protein